MANAMFGGALKLGRLLPDRLVEIVRLRVAFHNQCRSCMAIRYTDAMNAGVDEDLQPFASIVLAPTSVNSFFDCFFSLILMSITVQKVISKNPLKNQKPGFNQETLYRPVNFLFFELVVPFL